MKVLTILALFAICFFVIKGKPSPSAYSSPPYKHFKAIEFDTVKRSKDIVAEDNIASKVEIIKRRSRKHNLEDIWKLLHSSISTINEAYKFAHSQRLKKDSALNLANETKSQMQTMLVKQDRLESNQKELKVALTKNSDSVNQFDLLIAFMDKTFPIAFFIIMFVALLEIFVVVGERKLKLKS